MTPAPIPPSNILVVEQDATVADSILAELTGLEDCPFELKRFTQFAEIPALLNDISFDAIVLSVSSPDMLGPEALENLFKIAREIPILILASLADEAAAKQAVKCGARDYLIWGRFDVYSLQRALRYAIEHKTILDAWYIEKERAIVTLNSIGDAVLCTNLAGNITYLNLVAETLTGWPRQEAIGEPLSKVFQIVDAGSRAPARDPLSMAITQNRTVGLAADCILVRRDGFQSTIEDSAAPIHDRHGRVIGAVIVFHDISTARAMSLEMTRCAQHDVVTNLPNRLLLNDRISQAISLARRQDKHLAMIFLDLDRFKFINDSLGHAAGDQLLQSVAQRVVNGVRRSDTVSRQGGDEFVILLSEIALPDDAARSAQKILALISAPHTVDGQEVRIDASIGISIYPSDGKDAETLIKNADMAMYHAKQCGRNNFQFFKPEMNQRAVERQSLEASLRRALEREEFVLHYQPVIDLETGEITGVEALLRWQQPERGLVPPRRFIPIAENCGLIVPIGRWVLREACSQARDWQGAGLPPMTIAVNVSAVEFHDHNFVECVRTILAETGLDPRYLQLELTEGVLMKHLESTTQVLQELKGMGVCLAVDDFGTGYSSLSYLQQFPIDILKIDPSFVHQIVPEVSDSTIVAAIITMGKTLKHHVVAEGIETAEQRNHLQSLGCPGGQGFFFSRPVAADQFASLLRVGLVSNFVN